MLQRKTLRTLTRLFTSSLVPLLTPPAKPKKRKASAKAKPKPAARAQAPLAPFARSAPLAKALVPPSAADGRWTSGRAITGGGTRRFRLFVPPGRRLGEQVPLMVMLHGCDQNAEDFVASTRMHQLAAREGFAVLYPEQDRLANVNGCWNWFDTRNGRGHAEAALIMRAIDQACLYGADRTRVAIAGLSAGASMAALVVTRYPDRFQAVAMHSGVPPGTARSGLGALSAMYGHGNTKPLEADAVAMAAHWPALLVVHGGADRVVTPGNAEAAVNAWAEAAGARPRPARTVQRGQRHPMLVTDYRVRGRTVATLVQIPKLGHAWSGGTASQSYSDPQGPDASRLIWAFVQRQFARTA
ncbi:PHB depolymerase family esterase [Pseudorhodoferax sp. Leaf267]|uniref:extracellular catalytic domain type 1 short-chain-length polyhydroxyalkanoate depolymerase n=1 Tax=Pseudorhodoferax sp. Leaf267 TaxID=1736316 RepID=UPI0006F27382|nr:PHB depolymerase family esterase [Pseudorhodoferax sp. Leaf267]KQP21584.1 phospholipase [Pseudorhodoferax sp. Leaf267]